MSKTPGTPGAAPLPQGIDVLEFAKARAAEISAVHAILSKRTGTRRIVRKLRFL